MPRGKSPKRRAGHHDPHRKAIEDLQEAIDATASPGDEETKRARLRSAARAERDARDA